MSKIVRDIQMYEFSAENSKKHGRAKNSHFPVKKKSEYPAALKGIRMPKAEWVDSSLDFFFFFFWGTLFLRKLYLKNFNI